jgi:hypothetical protein
MILPNFSHFSHFICQDCADKKHEKCRNEAWCDCQHVVKDAK